MSPSDPQSGRSAKGPLFLLASLAIVALLIVTWRVGPSPALSLEPALPGIGKLTPITVRAEEPTRGLADLRVEVVQGGRVQLLGARSHVPREAWRLWGDRTASDEFVVEVGRDAVDFLEEGAATVRVTAERAGTWLRHPDPEVFELELPVILRPPSLQVISTATYLKQGGSEAVIYRVGESSVLDGVEAGPHWFPGYPLPGGDERDRFALFAAPHDLSDVSLIRLLSRDAVNNESRAAFVDQFTARELKLDVIAISDGFLERVVPAILGQTPTLRPADKLIDTYLSINNDLRAENARALVSLSEQSATEFHWHRPFLRMRNAKQMSGYAARRTYVYDSRRVDTQDHLGIDLASTRNAEIQAANDGVVLLASYFGIYGNAIMIDHGYGLASLYGHLSSLDVTVGEAVERGQVIGRSGQTGLAGGDHLHFSMLLHGVPVDPREWWDGHWIQDRIARKLGVALAFED